jgi:hypothetical protein
VSSSSLISARPSVHVCPIVPTRSPLPRARSDDDLRINTPPFPLDLRSQPLVFSVLIFLGPTTHACSPVNRAWAAKRSQVYQGGNEKRESRRRAASNALLRGRQVPERRQVGGHPALLPPVRPRRHQGAAHHRYGRADPSRNLKGSSFVLSRAFR